MTDERPQAPTFPVRARSFPKPAADEHVDPIDVAVPATSATPTPTEPSVPAEYQPQPAPPIDVPAPQPTLTEEPATSPEDPSALTAASTPVAPPASVAPPQERAAANTPAQQSYSAAPSTSLSTYPEQRPLEQTQYMRPRIRRQEVFVQVASRVTLETRDILDEIILREGISMRDALEKAIRFYGEHGAPDPR